MQNEYVSIKKLIEDAKNAAQEKSAKMTAKILEMVQEEELTFQEFDMILDALGAIRMYLQGGEKMMNLSFFTKDAAYILQKITEDK